MSEATPTVQGEMGRHQWCRYAGPGRGDCENFVGLPAVLDETTTDEYGIPHDWCDYCWMSHRNSKLHALVADLRAEVARLRAALEGIGNNTCCEGCGEAGRVARAALGGQS